MEQPTNQEIYVQSEALPLSCFSSCECCLGQMDEHVPPLLQGATQLVAVQLASYGEGKREGESGCHM